MMIKLYINNLFVAVPRGSSVLEACEYIGVSVPRFCYHERLNVAGNCRMCLVEIEKAPKPVASCAFPVTENMRVYTNTPLVHKARENVLEFLLINHPLDCPICDQGGECDLQEQTLVYGSDKSRFSFPKRGVEDKNCGPLIKTIMTRCIHCTRCVRFFQEIGGSEDFGTTSRGKETEIGTYIQKNINSELSGNIIDLCPVGALTSKPYAFTARPWELKSVDTFDITDGVGSNIKINFKETEILRILPRINDSLNDEWISDKTRFVYDSFKLNRLTCPYKKVKDKFVKLSWKTALSDIKFFLKKNLNCSNSPGDILFVGGSLLDLESLNFLKNLALNLNAHYTKEENLADTDFLCLTRSNTTLKNLENSDLILSVGANPRFEASMYDMKIKVRSRAGLFTRASIGLHSEYTYKNICLGTSMKTLLEILEGKHFFCKQLVKSKNPVIIFNSNIYKLINVQALKQILTLINKNCKLISDNWFGLDILSTIPNYSESNNPYFTNIKPNKIKLIYLVGVSDTNFIEKLQRICHYNKINVIIQQTPIGTVQARDANLILPSKLFVEKDAMFLNLENRVQKTVSINKGPGISKPDIDILKAIQHAFKLTFTTEQNKYLQINTNKVDFIKELIKKDKKKLNKINFSFFKASITDFFASDLISKNSLILSKCSKNLRKSYLNFLR